MSHTRELFFLCFLSIVSTILFLVSFSLVSAATITLPPNNLGLIGYWSFDDESGTVATDHSGNGNDGTLQGDPTWTNGKKGGALDFDGSDDYVDLATQIPNQTNGTYSAWIKYSGSGNSAVFGTSGGNPSYIFLFFNADNIFVGDNASSQVSWPFSPADFTDTWKLLTLVKSGSTLTLYVDGVSQGSRSMTNITPVDYIGTGQTGGGDYHFNGQIDDLRIYNRALTSTDIQALYNSGTAQRKTVSETNLIGHWTFDDASGDTATDSSGNNNTGTLQGDTTWTNGKKGTALSFDGDEDYVELSDSGFKASDTAITITAWVKPESIGVYRKILEHNLNSCFLFDVNINGNPRFNVCTHDDSVEDTSTVLQDWTHLAGVATENGQVALYVNGELVGTTVTTTFSEISTSGIAIGSDRRGTLSEFDGAIDDVRIYNTALSPEEIKTLYNETHITINSSQNNKLTDGLVGLWSFDGPDIAITQGGGGADYTVSGAGDSAFNGDYYEYGTNEGHPTYRLDDGHWISNSFDEWYLALDEEVSMCPGYYSVDDTITGTWDTICSSGPAPTVTAGGGGDSSATAYDRSGNSNDGTLTGDPTPDRGIIGQALRFDGSDDYVDLSAYPTNGSLDKEVTLAAWIKTGSGGVIFGKRNDWTTANDFTFDIVSGAAGTRVDWGNSGSILSYQSNDSSLLDDEWHHVVVVVDSSLAVETERVKFYHDGLYVGTTGTPSGGGALSQDDTLDLNDSIDLAIGARRINVGGESFFNGLIDDPRIYNRALSASEVMQLYKLGARE